MRCRDCRLLGRSGLAWQAQHLETLYSWCVGAMVAGWTPRWFGVTGAALGDSLFFAGALPRLSLGGRRGGLAWQAQHL